MLMKPTFKNWRDAKSPSEVSSKEGKRLMILLSLMRKKPAQNRLKDILKCLDMLVVCSIP